MARQALAVAAGLFLIGQFSFPAAGQDPAHDLAQQFAGRGAVSARPAKSEAAKRRAAEKARETARIAADAKRRAGEARETAERLKADEIEMLARARAEADERRAEQLRAQSEIEQAERRQAEAESRAALAAAEAARKRDETRSQGRSDDVTTDDAEERRRAHRLRAEAARIAAEKAKQREIDRQVEVTRRVQEEDEQTRTAARLRSEAEERRLAREGEAEAAEAEARRADADLRRFDDDSYFGADEDDGERDSVADRDDGERGLLDSNGARGSTRVTVLLAMDPGHRGIRRWRPHTADPMVCLADRCYISAGADSPARELSRGRAFGPGVALGVRAGACRGSLTCVFRNVDLGGQTGWLQPIDLRILRHDRRQTLPVSSDATCDVRRHRLTCAETVTAPDYRAWIVPEGTADRAGPEALEQALESGLEERGASFIQ